MTLCQLLGSKSQEWCASNASPAFRHDHVLLVNAIEELCVFDMYTLIPFGFT